MGLTFSALGPFGPWPSTNEILGRRGPGKQPRAPRTARAGRRGHERSSRWRPRPAGLGSRRCHRAWPRSGREGARNQAQVTPQPASIFLLEAKEGGGIPPRCFQKNRRGRVREPGLGCVARARVLRRADLEAAVEAPTPAAETGQFEVDEPSAVWAGEKHDASDRHDERERHEPSKVFGDTDAEPASGKRYQQRCLSPSQVAPRHEIRIRRAWHRHSVRRIAHGPIVARCTPSASERTLRGRRG
jgi:hypothetical protein